MKWSRILKKDIVNHLNQIYLSLYMCLYGHPHKYDLMSHPALLGGGYFSHLPIYDSSFNSFSSIYTSIVYTCMISLSPPLYVDERLGTRTCVSRKNCHINHITKDINFYFQCRKFLQDVPVYISLCLWVCQGGDR